MHALTVNALISMSINHSLYPKIIFMNKIIISLNVLLFDLSLTSG